VRAYIVTNRYADKPRLRYLEAVTQEVLRWSRVVPLLGHAAGTPPVTATTQAISGGDQQHVEFRGFKIPRGTPVYLNLYAVLRDEKVWEHPNKFYAEHFYDSATGNLKNLDKNLAFSLGKIIKLFSDSWGHFGVILRIIHCVFQAKGRYLHLNLMPTAVQEDKFEAEIFYQKIYSTVRSNLDLRTIFLNVLF
jgi:hypothetical protein